ncbi:MAG: hypothetical protein H0W08_02555, partial [Acidobacteria bacterium]|nr:hypothetical protein [Acidobacteriota bacterium]
MRILWNTRCVSKGVTLVVAILASPALVFTQSAPPEAERRASQLSPFTADDMLKVATGVVLDLAEDGSRVAVVVRRLIDNDSVDHRRYGDPTYLPPLRGRLEIVDVKTGAKEMPFTELINVRSAAWSRDGQRLAILVPREAATADGFPTTALYLWDVARRSLTEIKPSQPIAVNSSLAWTPDGSSLVIALRSAELDREARTTFKTLTEGPVIVHKSSEPFLEWDLLGRSARTRSVATLNLSTGTVRAVVPQGRISSYQVARDGSFMIVMEDVTEK